MLQFAYNQKNKEIVHEKSGTWVESPIRKQRPVRILVFQLNPTIGDVSGNAERMIQAIEEGHRQGAELIVFPELALTGYPPKDLLLLPHFMESVEKYLEKIIQASQNGAVILGVPRKNPRPSGKPLRNSAALLNKGVLVNFADKLLLPTYDVFDESRYFEPGDRPFVWNLDGTAIAITICEDLWQHGGCLGPTSYPYDPVAKIAERELHPNDLNVHCLINLSASPYSLDKFSNRLETCLSVARSLRCPVILCNQAGGNDGLIFDGRSLYVGTEGLLKCARGFTEDQLFINTEAAAAPLAIQRDPLQELHQALVLGVRDYFHKSGFEKACLGLSGGIDSAVVACIAAEALGAEQLMALIMPSHYSSPESARDALLLAQRLKIPHCELPIENLFEAYLSSLSPAFEGMEAGLHPNKLKQSGITEENIQSRIRGMLLMAFSNKWGYLVLNTGNKSELALGYSTLYGDMCGALAVIGDVTKRQVYALAEWINRHGELIPRHTIERPPSAELRPNQKDSDTLPDYDVIDGIVQSYVEEHRSPKSIAERFQYPLELVEMIIKKIHDSEYKRYQAPPILRVSERDFSVGRQFPIVQGWIQRG